MVEAKAPRQVDPTLTASERLIVALDFARKDDANDLIKRLGTKVSFYKVGWTLFLNSGLDFVTGLAKDGKKVFLDLKMNDIGATMEDAVRSIASSGVEFLTLHGSGQTAEAACRGRGKNTKPKFLSVTYLSSLDQTDLKDVFSDQPTDLNKYIQHRADLSLKAGCDGLIASGNSVGDLRRKFTAEGRYPLIVVPGIRPSGVSTNDHKRTLTPGEAIQAGADYLVVGRPIREAADQVEAVTKIIAEIDAAVKG